MELLQRDIQRRILQELSEIYPRSATMRSNLQGFDPRQLEYNLFYLQEHGFVTLVTTKLMSGEMPIASCGITAAGIDFIADDGGLSAILGVVTIKIHEDTIRELLIDRVQASPVPSSMKENMVSTLKKLPAEALKQISLEAMKSGLHQVPDIVQWITTLLPK